MLLGYGWRLGPCPPGQLARVLPNIDSRGQYWCRVGPPLSPIPRLGLIKIWVAEMDQMGGGSILRGSDEIGVACECHWEYGLSEAEKWQE